MFQLITVPNAKLKDAALQCLSSASVADTSASEMESLIGLLDVKGQELQSSFTYLERIMSQLNKMLTAQSGYGALMSNSISTASMCLRANQSLSRSSVTAVTAAVPPVSVISVPGRLEQEESNLEAWFDLSIHGLYIRTMTIFRRTKSVDAGGDDDDDDDDDDGDRDRDRDRDGDDGDGDW
eukprot:s308_g77.t1